jgi:D-glycero-D-manno-heptose 1,7-bisphosphate phosphatase
MRRAVFLDRDGVINRAVVRDGKPYPPATLDGLEILAGVGPAVQRLKDAGFVLVGVTNQPDVARGTTPRATVEAINASLLATLPLDDILVCYHDEPDGCDCRKPRPGLLLQASRRFGIELRTSFMVGDRWRDVEAGRAAGCRTVFVDYAYAETGPKQPDATVGSLPEAVEWILSVAGISDLTGREA